MADLINSYLRMCCLGPGCLFCADFRMTLQIQPWLAYTGHKLSWKNRQGWNPPTLLVSLYPVCLLLKENLRGSNLLDSSIMCLVSFRHCTLYGTTLWPVALCSQRVNEAQTSQ